MGRKPRFPGVVWYCDHCNAVLNSQDHFDDHKYTWKCKNCGFKNSISWDSISADDSFVTKLLLYFIGFLSYVGFWTSIMLTLSIFVFQADRNVYLMPLFIFAGIYLIAFIIGIIIEFAVRHTKLSIRNLVFVVVRNLKEDIFAPLMMAKEFLSNLFSIIIYLIPNKRMHSLNSNIKMLVFAIIYLVIFALEIIWFNRINSISANDWLRLIQNCYLKFHDFITNL